ncbi:MAG: TolC family protein [Candidatus Krumholzibacteriia bacterium]
MTSRMQSLKSRFHTVEFFLATLLVFPAAAGADTSSTTSARLDSTSGLAEYVTYAMAQNPFLRSFADRFEAAREVPSQARALPDPMLAVGVFASSPETRVGPQEGALMVSQRLPFFGKLSLRGQIADKDADIWGQTYEEKALDLVRDVKRAYYEYYRVHEIIDVTEKEKAVIRQMQNVAQVKYASALVGQQDVLKAQLALSNLDDRLTSLRRDLVTVTARLNELLNRDPGAPLAVPRVRSEGFDLENLDSLYELALSKRPEVAAADLSIERSERSRSLAKKQYYPDLTLGFSYVTVDQRPVTNLEDNGKDAILFSASINIPIWYQKLGAAVRESEARISMAKHRRQGIETRIRNEVQDARSRVQAARDLVNLYANVILPQAEQTFRASEAGYQTGRVDFLDYLDSERSLLAFRQTYFVLVADLGRQYADFERTLGVKTAGVNR